MNIFYRLNDKLFANITNECPCDCIFCIRNMGEGMNEGESLWLPHEPSMEEIIAAFDARKDISEIEEIVFCGYGEPLQRADDVVELTKYFKEKSATLLRSSSCEQHGATTTPSERSRNLLPAERRGLGGVAPIENKYKPIRISTNGLVRLIHPSFDISKLACADMISVSLNADDAEEYNRVTRPRFGVEAYDELLRFVEDVKEFTAVTVSVVGVIDPHRIENCRKIAERLGVIFRLR
jgi:MoaA/NifB/PqqE/SkfB family radical SAM enzyme